MNPDPSQEERRAIARRAYERFEARGREHGHHVEDWLDAEREIHGQRVISSVEPPRQKVDEAGEESFPASDPPSWTPTHAGSPRTRKPTGRPREQH